MNSKLTVVSNESAWSDAATLCLSKQYYPVTPENALGIQGTWGGPTWTGVRRNKAVFPNSTVFEGTV